jgi:hypothetical protein
MQMFICTILISYKMMKDFRRGLLREEAKTVQNKEKNFYMLIYTKIHSKCIFFT